MRDDDTDIEALPASVSFRFVSFRYNFVSEASRRAYCSIRLLQTNTHWTRVRRDSKHHRTWIAVSTMGLSVPTSSQSQRNAKHQWRYRVGHVKLLPQSRPQVIGTVVLYERSDREMGELQYSYLYRSAGCCLPASLELSYCLGLYTCRRNISACTSTTEVDRPSRPTGYIPTPANANSHWEVMRCVASWTVLYPVTRWSRGQHPIGRNAMKTRETWNTDGRLWCQTFSNIAHIIGNSLESFDNAYNSTAPPK